MLEAARHLRIDMLQLERAYEQKSVPANHEPASLQQLEFHVQQAAWDVVKHAAQGNWQVVAQPHLQPAISHAEQLFHQQQLLQQQQQAHPQQFP